MNIVQNFLNEYFSAKNWMHHHTLVSGMAALSAFVVVSSTLFGLGHTGTYASSDGAADMSISNNASVQDVEAGDTVVFLYFYQNEDYPNKLASNITVTSLVPAGMSYVSATPSPTSMQGDTLEWDNLSDDYGILTVEMQVDDINASLASTAWVSADGEDPYMNNNSAIANLQAHNTSSSSSSSDLSISTTASSSLINAGQTVQYTLSYANISNNTAEGTIVVDSLPEGVTYLSADPAPSSIDGNSLAWNLGNIGAGSDGTITVRGTVSTLLDDGFNILNFASIDSTNDDSDVANNVSAVSSEVLNDGTDLYVNTTAASDKAKVNEDFTLDILMANRGPKTADNVITSFTLPAGMSIVSASPNYTSNVGKTYGWYLNSLNVGGMSTITLTLHSSVNAIYDLVASISSDTSETSNADNSSLFALTIGSTSTASASNGGGGGGGRGGGGDTVGSILQAVEAELTPSNTTHTAASGVRSPFEPSEQAVQAIVKKVDAAKYPLEMIQAFLFAKNVGMTSFDDITKAMMYKELTRAQLAKFAVEYATNILDMKPDMNRSKACFAYTDTAKAGDLLQYIQYSCMMKLLGQKADGETPAPNFRPKDLVTRAEFGTFMSRLVFGDTYNSKSPNDPKWYQAHLEALKKNGIITQIDTPMKPELRAWALVIMYRTAEFLANK